LSTPILIDRVSAKPGDAAYIAKKDIPSMYSVRMFLPQIVD
jgi:hypothetical protein